MVLDGKNIREIHRKLFEMTVKMPKMYLFMEKVSNRSVKTVDRRKTSDENAWLLLLLFNKSQYNSKIKRVINHELMEKAELDKHEIIKEYLKHSRDQGRYIYLASSHNDCAADHRDYQGKLYYDENAPDDIVSYCKKQGYRSIQWVMDAPVYFITRPNCRHFFRAVPTEAVKEYSRKELTRRYKTHRMAGDRSLATPAKVAVEEYEDRLHMLKGMYREHPTERLRREIQKTELLIKKWKNIL